MAKSTLPLSPEAFAAISRALAEPRRFAMLQQIASQESLPCACLDMRETLSPATISHHLKELQEAQLVTVQREGRGVRLILRHDTWEAYLQQLANLGR